MMEIVKKSLSSLRPSEKNVRKHNTRQISEMIKAIDSFGVIRPIVIDENDIILCGHGLYQALVEKGDEVVDCIVASGLTEKQKKKLMLADNKIYDLGTSDFEAIDDILKELGLENDFSVPGYDAKYLEDLYGLKSVQKAAEELPDIPQFDSPVKELVQEKELLQKAEMPTPSVHVQEERQRQLSAKRIIVCPHCGGVVEL